MNRDKYMPNGEMRLAAMFATMARIGYHQRENNPAWKGDGAGTQAAHNRARRWYGKSKEPCAICDSEKSEIHHIDSNPYNNEPDNIQWVCRKHHVAIDGRMDKIRSVRRGEEQVGAKLTDATVLEMRNLPLGITNDDLAEMYGVSRSTAWLARTGRTWKHLPIEKDGEK